MYRWGLRVAAILLAVWPALVGCGKSQPKPKPTLREELEAVIAAKRQAELAGDAEAWKATVSSRFYAEAHNLAVSTGQDLDSARLRAFATTADSRAQLPFVKTLEHGDTAGLLYVQDLTQPKEYKPAVLFTLRRFVREGGSWRFDNSCRQSMEKFGPDGKGVEFHLSSPRPDKEINGIVGEAPPLCRKPDYYAETFTLCSGLRLKVLVNDFPAVTLDDSQYSGVLIGGLRGGRNTVRIEISPKPDPKLRRVEVSIYRHMPDGPPKYLLSYKPEGQLPPAYETVIDMPLSSVEKPAGASPPRPGPSPSKPTSSKR